MADGAPGVGAPQSISLQGLSKSFGQMTALFPTDLDVRSGEFLTLLGPSGSGKSTLLNLIAGALAPSSGTIRLDGKDLTNVPPRDRGIGMVFQNYALMPHMTVFDNVAFPLRVRRQPTHVVREKVAEALARVGLTGFEKRKPKQLSGGQQQRVGIARCIVYSPAIILMDEPLGALDKNLREQMQGEIKHLHQDLGTTFIYVTHDQEEALNMSDRICLMSVGRIAQLGTPDDLYFRPRSRYVAEFLGESNIISGRAAGKAKLAIAEDCNIGTQPFDHPKGTELATMFRPEKLSILTSGEEPGRGENTLSGSVKEIFFFGRSTRIHLITDGGFRLIATVASLQSDARPEIGSRLRVSWKPEDSVILEQ